MWLIIFGSAIVAAILGLFYMTACIGRFGAVRKLAGERKWLKNLISFMLIAAALCIISFTMSAVNAAVVLLIAVMFFLLSGGLVKIAAHFSGKEFSINWQGWIALAATAVYLISGYYLLHHVWQKNYSIKTDKNIRLKIAMFADSHLGTTFDGEEFSQHINTIEKQAPDILLIPGDFVDDSTKKADLIKACEALGSMNVKYGVWYAYGNHDKGYYNSRDFSATELEQIMTDSGIHVLSDEYELIDDSFYVVGRKDSGEDRKDMDELLEGVDKSKYIVVLDHEPNDYANEADSGVDLVVSGHTHGGQLFPITYVGEWFNINDRTYGHEKRKDTDFIVTSGISDWEIQFKTGAKSEYVIIDVEN